MVFVAAFLLAAGAAVVLTGFGDVVPLLGASLAFVSGGAWLVALRCRTWPAPARRRFTAAGALGLFVPAVTGIAGQAFRVSCGDDIFPWGSMVYLAAVATIGLSFPLLVLAGELVARRSASTALGGLAGAAVLAVGLALATFYSRFFEVAFFGAWISTAALLCWAMRLPGE